MKAPLSSPAGILRWMLGLSLPVLAEELLNLLVGYTDWWLTGRFLPGAEYKAAMGLMSYTTWLIPGLFAAIAIGATALVARAIGAGDRRQARHIANQAVLIGVVLAAAVTTLAIVAAPAFVRAMQLEGEAADLAVRYLRILTVAIPAIMIEQIAAASLRGAGDMMAGLFAKSIVNAVNIAVSTALVTGAGPLPRLGWDGLAIGTASGHFVGGAILLAFLLRGRSGLRLRRCDLNPDESVIRSMLRIGLPGGADVLLTLFCHLTYVAIINSLGTMAAAAHGLGVQIEAMAYLPGSAFGVAAATMAGQFLGAHDPRGATRAVITACGTGMLVTGSAGLAFFFGGHALATFFTGDGSDPTAVQTAALLKITALSMPSLAIVMVVVGGLRGAGDTRWPLIISLVGYFGIRLPGACLLAWDEVAVPWIGVEIAGAGLGVAGAWWAMLVDEVARSLLVLMRFIHGGWRR